MPEVIATLPAEQLAEAVEQIRTEARAHDALETPSLAAAPFDPFHPASSILPDPEDAIGLVRRGVRVAPFAETTPLLPLYAARKEEVPPELQVAHDQHLYDFYLVQLTFSVGLVDDEAPDYAEFAVEIQDGVQGPRASRAIEVFPQRIDTTLFTTEGQLSVALDASLKFSAARKAPGMKAEVEADAHPGVKVLVGPFRWEVGRTELEVRGEGDREVGWTYKVTKALEGKNDFKSFLVVKVARETKRVGLKATIGVRPYRRTWQTLWLREKLPVMVAQADLELELATVATASSTPA